MTGSKCADENGCGVAAQQYRLRIRTTHAYDEETQRCCGCILHHYCINITSQTLKTAEKEYTVLQKADIIQDEMCIELVYIEQEL